MQTVKLDERLYRTNAENGVTVLSEVLPGVRSVAVGIWVKSASVHEEAAKMGVSHLLEHMVFKGTERRSARDIALELEVRGGALDAFTSREYTSYQARVLDEDLPRALDVLTDVVRNPALRNKDLELERKVVLEEISTVEDTPDDLVFELHAQTMWPTHPYGFSILGTRDTVGGLDADDLRALHRRAYHPRHVIIAAAGSLNHELLVKLAAKCGWFTYDPGPQPPAVAPVPAAGRTTRRVQRDTAQAHIVLGTDTFAYRDARREPLMLLNTVLGGGMSSRLFQRVREELGLAYAVSTYQSFYLETGVTGVYVGTHPSTADQAVEVILGELNTLASAGLSGSTLAEAKQQLKGQITLGLESPTARMYRLATVELYGEPYRTIDQLLADVDGIPGDEVAAVAEEFFDPARQTVVWLGPN
ncbi:MAG: insulinase family protein [Gemmatimonadales bacterium]|nr:insulinase family protein [Gemmatimonadales bacterium]NIN11673.1 insulinase family protein [Gemmatimonadales bacterium]NIN50279.1 insulinase family protein [Gemmatimonadales bacterium]NIP07743.1 insulinase family protein [Gemmatimonadales bacterium]NIQ99146.1 insulinase family protein [Gemmatimonadales bacterium]